MATVRSTVESVSEKSSPDVPGTDVPGYILGGLTYMEKTLFSTINMHVNVLLINIHL